MCIHIVPLMNAGQHTMAATCLRCKELTIKNHPSCCRPSLCLEIGPGHYWHVMSASSEWHESR